MENKKERKTTTIAVSVSDNERLTEYCDTYNILKKDFISIVLNFLENNGVNPKTDNAPKTELTRIKKRIDYNIGFIKTQEKELIRPAIQAIIKTEERLKRQINDLAKKKDLSPLLTQKKNRDYINQAVVAILNEIKNCLYEQELRLDKQFEVLESEIREMKNKRGFYL